MKLIKLAALILIAVFAFSGYGCFKAIVETREPLPDIIWPNPPEIPRIRFVNSISQPEDLNIRDTLSAKLLNFFRGTMKASIVKPYGIVTDPAGRIYVVDNFLKLVHVFDTVNNDYYVFPRKETKFVSPIDIAIDRRGNIYVSDSKVASVKVFADQGRTFVTEFGSEILSRPTGLAVNDSTGELLVIDTTNSEILRYDLNTYKFMGKIGREGNAPGTFHYPTNMFVAKNGNILVTDSLNFRIQIFSPDGIFLKAFGKPGDSPGYFARPRGVAADSDGNIYIVDAMFDNIQIFNSEGDLLMDFGRSGSGYGEFWLPSGIFIDRNDRIYISDSFNKRIQVFQYLKGETLSP
ncbi:MAG: 6-bladed beta-propeller [Nitrospiraceae bacterium]|nr:MAG: 6-bladed beta-propeller [Nitrospiraceae bacterium]